MAPARRRGTKGEKGNSRELKLGDLVLAKVKGFPAWPAKISRPEDWDRVPDPKKYFVQFFGTEEIAFVAPADIQAFTNEAKNKVLARCQAKTVKYFAPAVKEICQAFEQLKHKNSGSSSDVIDKSDVDRDALSANGEEDVLEDGLKDGSSTDGISREPEVKSLDNSGPGLECCSQRHKVLDCHDIKSSVSCKEGESFPPVVSPKKKKQNKRANDEVHTLKEVVLALSCPKDEVHEDNQEDADDARKDVGKDSLLVKSARSRDFGTGKKVVVNGQKTGKMTTEPNKKFKESHDNNNDDSSTVFARPKGSSTCINGCPDDHSKDSIVRKSATRSSWRDLYEEPKLNVDTSGEKKKELGKHRKTFQIVKGQKDAGDNPEQLARPEFSGLKKGAELGCTEYELGTNEVSYAAKTAKHSDAAAKYASKGILQGRKHGSGCSIDIGQKAANHTAEDRSASKVQIGKTFSHISSDEDDLPPTKLRCWASEAPSNSANKRVENRVRKFSLAKKNDESHADLVKSTVTQLHKKRRALRMYDDDDEERPKTPVHGRPASRVNLSASLKKTELKVESADDFQITSKDSGAVGSRPSEERSCSVRVVSELSSINSDLPLDKKSKKVIAVPVPPSPAKPLDRVTTKKQISGSPKKSPLIGGASYRQVSELTKADGLLLKVSGVGNQKRTQTGPVKGSSDGVRNAQSLVNSERGKAISSERSRSIEHNSTLEVNNTDYVRGSSAKDSTFSGGRLDSGVDNGMDQFVGSKISQSPMSMRNLIAAAQARRKQAHSQNNIHGDANTLLAPSSDKPMRSASPSSDVQHSLPESSNVLQPDVQRLYSNTSKVSPHHDLSSDNQPGAKEYEETRVGLGLLPSAGLLSGGTDAAVARDAFEGMIETLSRTRESIRRATRLAIDCAKYGIANEVVEVLIRKLESEPDNHRKIDLFFLVDSITQCSHTQKGIAGASYIPTVQAALPRLLGAAAAAPPGAAAHENRRQCLKVLRLWLERKILPDSLLQRYIDGMGVSDDDASAGFFLRHPSRTERAVDDPIREMDGMLVDEYGSNATFQLPGFLSSHVFEDDEDDVPGPSYAEPCGESPTEELPAAGDSEACAVTPTDRRHCILEHVDGELEMEDVSGHPKDEQSLCENSSIEFASKQLHSDEFMVADSEELSPLCGSPPLPHNSPPPTPPLPSSSPPSSSPPPPPSSPSAPPPPPFLSLPQSLPVPPSGPRLSLLTQPSLPPAMMSQQVHLPPSSIPNVAPNLAYQPPLTLENCSIRSGNQFAQTAASTTLRDHTDASVREEMYGHQSISFMPAGINSSNEASRFSSSRPLDYGNHDLHVNSQASQPNQHFQPGNPPFPQRPFHPVPLPSHSSHYIYQTSPANQLLQNPYSRPYSLPNLPDGTSRYVADEQWRSANEFKSGNSRGAWMSGGGNPSCSAPSGAPYAREGYFSSPFERTNMSKVGFQPTTPNTVLSGAPVPGHAVSPSLPSRPDMPGVNRWRPS